MTHESGNSAPWYSLSPLTRLRGLARLRPKPITSGRIATLKCYGVALAAVTVALLVSVMLEGITTGASPLLIFLSAVMISAWYGGLRPGLMATILGSVGIVLWIAPPLSVGDTIIVSRLVRLGLFLLNGTLISGLCAILHRSWQRADLAFAEAQSAFEHHEEALARLDTLLASAPIAFAFLDENLRYVRVNDAMVAFNQLPLKDHVGRTLSEVIPHIAPTAEPLMRAVLTTGVPIVDLDMPSRDTDRLGRQRHWLGNVYPVRAPDGQPCGIGVALVDVSERRYAEQAQHFLAEASATLASSLDYETTLARLARLAVVRLADWCIVHVIEHDQSVRQLAVAHIDPTKEDVLRALDHVCPPGLPWPNPMKRVLRTSQAELVPEVSEALFRSITCNAEHEALLRTLGLGSFMIVPLVTNGQMLGTIVFALGDTARHYGASELQLAEDLARRAAMAIYSARLYREAQEAVQARDEFMSIAAHELKTPLTSISGYAQLLQRRTASSLSERDQRAVQVIADQSERLNRLIALLLDLSRIQMGRLTIERTAVDVCTLVARLVAEMQPALERHTVEYTCPDQPLVILGDEVRLEQVIQNLLQNAIKYSPQGGPIRVALQHCDGQAHIAVIDRGIGIPESARSQLFQRFYRASNVDQRRVSGLGVGLYVVQDIVALHGGTVAVTSTVGQGSTFNVYLPLPSQAALTEDRTTL